MISQADANELFELFTALKRATGWTNKQTYSHLELSRTQGQLLLYIAEHDGVSQTELAKATGNDKALTGRVLQPLIERGWLRRDRSDVDARAYILHLAPAGRKVIKHLDGIRDEVLERVSRTLDPRDVTDFRRIVSKLLNSMKSDIAR
jgi:DNA-binding MarR family transcriptional regulator